MNFKPGDLVQIKQGCRKSTHDSKWDLPYDTIFIVKKSEYLLLQLEGHYLTYSPKRFELVDPKTLTKLERVIYDV